MGDLNANSYRKRLLQKLQESDLPKEEKIVAGNKIILETAGQLKAFAEELFKEEDPEDIGADEDVIIEPDEEIIDVPAKDAGNPDMLPIEGSDDSMLLGGELGDTDGLDDAPLPPSEDLVDPSDELGMDIGANDLGINPDRNMDDLVADTVLEILTHFKDIRDEYVAQDPDKAAIVRKVYDYLFKAKDKIAGEITKDKQTDVDNSQQIPSI